LTVNHHLKLLKAMFNRAIRQGRLTYNAVTGVKLYQEHGGRNRCLNGEEEARLPDALPERLRPLVTVALNTGMPRGEPSGAPLVGRGLRHRNAPYPTA
jgi:hypothetical protein